METFNTLLMKMVLLYFRMGLLVAVISVVLMLFLVMVVLVVLACIFCIGSRFEVSLGCCVFLSVSSGVIFNF